MDQLSSGTYQMHKNYHGDFAFGFYFSIFAGSTFQLVQQTGKPWQGKDAIQEKICRMIKEWFCHSLKNSLSSLFAKTAIIV